jgi:hypothetical protein
MKIMNTDTMKKCVMSTALAALAGCGEVTAADAQHKNPCSSDVKETVVTNKDGSVTRTKTEKHSIKDADGNVIGYSTSTFSETVSADLAAGVKGDEVKSSGATAEKAETASPEEKRASISTDGSSFMGLKFGEVPAGVENATEVPGQSALKMFKFTPEKKLKGFDDYYAFVTPKTHKLVKVCACAKQEVLSNTIGRRHYLVEALERRYKTSARLASWLRPLYVLDISPARGVSICLQDASDDYETIISAWDDEAARTAVSEQREIRDALYRKAIEERDNVIKEAADVF